MAIKKNKLYFHINSLNTLKTLIEYACGMNLDICKSYTREKMVYLGFISFKLRVCVFRVYTSSEDVGFFFFFYNHMMGLWNPIGCM